MKTHRKLYHIAGDTLSIETDQLVNCICFFIHFPPNKNKFICFTVSVLFRIFALSTSKEKTVEAVLCPVSNKTIEVVNLKTQNRP